jgi:FixJ family two-component response regulator
VFQWSLFSSAGRLIVHSTVTSHPVSLVEDDAAVRNSLGNFLNSAGLTVARFASAEEFLSWRRAGSSSCLILDVKLPQMSGIELQQLLIAASDSVPIIFITADSDNNLRMRALRNGAVAFFYKPFNAEALLAVVQRAVTASQTVTANRR